uniref:Uncharacterized protein n=1 Tax=Clytia hemisphaerica TaxID=252671 RepID=A0A7M5X5H8_9CNID
YNASKVFMVSFQPVSQPDVSGSQAGSTSQPIQQNPLQQISNSADTSSHTLPINSRRDTTPKCVLATVKVMRADLDGSGKPCNTLKYNHELRVLIYQHDKLNVGYVTKRVREEMGNNDLTVVGNKEFIIYEQEGTRG